MLRFEVSIAAMARFKKEDRDMLVNVGSIPDFAGYSGTSACSATKPSYFPHTRTASRDKGQQRPSAAGRSGRVITEGWDSFIVDSSICDVGR